MGNQQLVSVIVTARDADSYLNACVESIAASTYENLQIVVVNDGSTDHTGDILDDWSRRESRVQVTHSEPVGRNAALKLAHNQAEGVYQCWVDADDLVHPTGIAEAVTKISSQHQLVYTHRQLIRADGNVHGPDPKNRIPYRPNQILVDNMIFHLRVFTTEIFHASGGVGDLASSIDWDMNLRMTEHTEPRCIPRILYSYRTQPGRMSGRPEQHIAGQQAVKNAIERRGLDAELVINNTGWHLRKPTKTRTGLQLPPATK